MAGWVHLPRFIDKIRLHQAGRLGEDYRANLTKGFDGAWLEAAGVEAGTFMEVVRGTITDGEVCDWVARHGDASDEVKREFNALVLNRGKDTQEMKDRLKMRKEQAGLGTRDDIQCMVDFIDADEGRV
jgi:hypothetical protein